MVVGVILSVVTDYGLTEEWFMLLLLFSLPLVFKILIEEWFIVWVLYTTMVNTVLKFKIHF